MNPLMALFVYRNVAVFAAMKIGLTSASIVLMVVLARHRFMRLVQVTWVLYGVLIAYATLIAYELWMLKGFARPADLVILPGAVTFHIVPPWARLRVHFKTPLPCPSC